MSNWPSIKKICEWTVNGNTLDQNGKYPLRPLNAYNPLEVEFVGVEFC